MHVRQRSAARVTALLLALAPLGFAGTSLAGQTIDGRMHHLRWGSTPEWADFPERPESAELVVRFDARRNAGERAFRVRHRDLKQVWRVALNGKEVAALPRDEPETVKGGCWSARQVSNVPTATNSKSSK